MMIERLSIIGVGLIGGSVGLAAREHDVARTIVGIGRTPEHLERALEKQAIDEYTTELAEGVKKSELVIMCLPVDAIVEFLPQVAQHADPGALVTDVGSTKAKIMAVGERCCGKGAPVFIGSHPLAGSEKTGVEHASASLLKGATCFITVSDATPVKSLRTLVDFWHNLGMRPFIVRAERHDSLVGASSHAVHFAAAAVAKAFSAIGEDPNLLRLIIGDGFKDTTRIAQSDVDLWVEISRQNASAIAESLEYISREIAGVKEAIADEDFEYVRNFLTAARTFLKDMEHNE